MDRGYYPFPPKSGYIKGNIKNIREQHPEVGHIMASLLKKMAARQIQPSEALKLLNSSDFSKHYPKYRMDRFRVIYTDPFYAGILMMDKQIKVSNPNGLHEAMISVKEHKQLLAIEAANPKNQEGPSKQDNPDYPVSNLFTCPSCLKQNEKYPRWCGIPIKNGRGKIYKKYRCRGCHKYLRQEEVHSTYVSFFDSVGVNDSKKLKKALLKVFERRRGNSDAAAKNVAGRIKVLEEEIRQKSVDAVEQSSRIVKEQLIKYVEDLDDEREQLTVELSSMQSDPNQDLDVFLDFAFGFIESVGSNLLGSSKANRVLCTQMIFPDKILMSHSGKMYTHYISPIYRLNGYKKDAEASDFGQMVRVKRL